MVSADPALFYGSTQTTRIPSAPKTPPQSNVEVEETDDLPNSTPQKYTASGSLVFTSTSLAETRDRRFYHAAIEMKNKAIGPIPPADFLNYFLPRSVSDNTPLPLTKATRNKAWKAVSEKTRETDMYEPFIAAARPFLDNDWVIKNTSNNPDVEHTALFSEGGLKPDLTVYDVPHDNESADFTLMDSYIEFKFYSTDDPFEDDLGKGSILKDTEYARGTLGQITTYANAILGNQFRTTLYTLLIIKEKARILRWDRSGVIYTSAFAYAEEDHLSEFWWRYSRSARDRRGHDTSVSALSMEETALHRAHKGLETGRLFSMNVKNSEGVDSCYIVGIPFTKGHVSLTGRATRCFTAYDVEQKRSVLLKDTWRVLATGFEPEGKVYERLQKANVPHVPKCLASGDVDDQTTLTLTGLPEHIKKLIRAFVDQRKLRHYRLVLDIVGRDLRSFRSPLEMVTAIRDAFEAHKIAYEVANVLHRDVSIGNILLDSEGHGLLIDWDLSKDITLQEARVTERTATWQFMSARLLRAEDPSKVQHELQDDMESFLHVLCWLCLRYVKHTMSGADLRHLLTSYFDDAVPIYSHNNSTNPNSYTGGHTKLDKLRLGGFDDVTFAEPIHTLLKSLFGALGARYGTERLRNLQEFVPKKAQELLDQTKDSTWMLDTLTKDTVDSSKWTSCKKVKHYIYDDKGAKRALEDTENSSSKRSKRL